uniref:RNase H type-1 domain-containing protein n=1 Tax=Brassica oleracea var. oleracea TaxID=109376 RepID=A0A0D2ZXQ0_BRAOL
MKCMKNLRQFQVTFATDCSQLVKMVSEPEEWPAFESYLEDIKLLKGSFLNSVIVHVPRTANLRADRLARSARKQSSFIVHMDAELPIWSTEST